MADFANIRANFKGGRSVSANFLSSLGLLAGSLTGTITGCTVTLGSTETLVNETDIILADILDDSGTTVTISSDNANDTSAGIGARTVLVEMLNDNFETSVQVITMDGQNAVTLSGIFSRFQSMTVLTAGNTLIPNEGTIYIGEGTVTAGVPADKFATIEPTVGKSIMSLFTVPNNRVAIVSDLTLTATADGNKDVTFFVRTRQNGGLADEPFIMLDSLTVFKASVPILAAPIYVFDERTDVSVTAKASAGNSNIASIKAGFDLVTKSRLEK